jgi:hypothetical protein
MSEHITHLAVAEDSIRLALHDSDFSDHIRFAVNSYPHILQLGSVTRSGDTFIFPLITEWKKDWEREDPRSKQMAYILGWAGHLAADRTFKPVFRITDLAYYVRGYPGPAHASIYHDAITFSQVYHDGETAPFHPSALQPAAYTHPAADILPVTRLEEAMGFNFAGHLAEFKTFLPNEIADWEKQWEAIENEKQRFYVGIDRYTEAHHNSDAHRMRQYIIDPNFYNADDPIIALTRALQEGRSTSISLKDALEGTDDQSLYAQSLKLGYDFMMACSHYFEGNIDLEEAKKRMRTFQPHRQSLDYYIEMAEKGE